MPEMDWNEREHALVLQEMAAGLMPPCVEIAVFDRSQAPRGFAALLPETVAVMAARGGKRVHESGRGYRFTSEAARVAGRKGGRALVAKRKAAAQ